MRAHVRACVCFCVRCVRRVRARACVGAPSAWRRSRAQRRRGAWTWTV